MDEQEIQKQLIAIFQDEARERIEALFSGLSSLENADEETLPDSILESVFREAHSLKGAARSVNLPVIESLCQEMESIFAAIKSNALTFSAELFDSLYAATRLIEESISPDADPEETTQKININVQSLREMTRRSQSTEQVSANASEKSPAKRSDAKSNATKAADVSPEAPLKLMKTNRRIQNPGKQVWTSKNRRPNHFSPPPSGFPQPSWMPCF